MESYLLNDGKNVPALGFGTYQLLEEDGLNAIRLAISKGYRLIDTAAHYGNEDLVGKAILESDVKRSDLFITTKLWRQDLGYEATLKAFRKSIQKLKIEYVDVYLIHWPANAKNFENWQQANADTWRAMENLQQDGKIRSIGVSNFWPEHLEALSKTAIIPPAVNQIEFHPGYWQKNVVEYCKGNNILVEAWSPLARGEVLGNQLLQEIATRHYKTVGQVCLRWGLQHQAVVIPKSSSADRIEENFNIFNFELSNEEMLQIDSLPEMGFSGELPNDW